MPRKRTQEEFEQIVLEKLGPDYKVLGKYVNKDTKILMQHYICGNEFLKRPHDIAAKGSGCPYCNGSKPAKYSEEYVKQHTPEPFVYDSGYTNFSTKCKFYCKQCRSYFEQTPRRIIIENIHSCKCTPNRKKTHEDFLLELGDECLLEYEILDQYQGIDKPIGFKHKKCNTTFSLTPYQFIIRHSKLYCPICYYKKSKGEIAITEFLTQYKINFQKEFSFIKLPNKKFDFYLPEYQMAIEFDGAQHFYPIDFFGGEQGLKDTQRRDKEKNQFCLDNNITLLRIPYTEFEFINKILYEIFEEQSSTTIEKFTVKVSEVEQPIS